LLRINIGSTDVPDLTSKELASSQRLFCLDQPGILVRILQVSKQRPLIARNQDKWWELDILAPQPSIMTGPTKFKLVLIGDATVEKVCHLLKVRPETITNYCRQTTFVHQELYGQFTNEYRPTEKYEQRVVPFAIVSLGYSSLLLPVPN
jgi:hypothetical protein